jgi:acetolactate decarboxylase
MKRFAGKAVIIISALFTIALILASQVKGREELYQVSVLSGLMKGDYSGKVRLSEIARHGDFGIGTFDRLDGEAVELNGIFYRAASDGTVRRMPDTVQAPFAMATFFDTDITFAVQGKPDYKSLQKFIDERIPSKNIPYAVRVKGKFGYIKVRSVPAQEKPYPALAEVVKHQSVFEYRNIEGTLVGFRIPDYMSGVNTPGYHMHFLSRDRARGGHLLECAVDTAEVALDDVSSVEIALPGSKDFYALDFALTAAGAVKEE